MASVKSGTVVRSVGLLFDEGSCVGLNDAQLLERFVGRRDEAAFEALVVRHGRLVLAVCRGVLRDPNDAEDAFQAAFLILARKAGSLWVADSLAAWLHRVARRVAIEANRQKARRQAIERTGLGLDAMPQEARESTEDLWPALHEEIDRLPEKYRAPIVLCDLEELTRDEAARRLGWPPGTVAGRLARARLLLRDRLVRRGQLDGPGLTAFARVGRLASGADSASWVRKTVQLATLSHAGAIGTTTLATAGGALLARGVLRDMMVATLKKSTVVSAVAALAATAGTLVLATASPEAPAPQVPAGVATARVETPPARPSVSGTLLLPDGRPAGDVRVFYSTRDHVDDHGHIRAETTSDTLGRFSLVWPPVGGAWPGMFGSGTLWIYRPGSFVASMPVYRGALPSGSSLRLVVGPPAGALFEVHDPADRPLAGVRIRPRALDRHRSTSVPDRLADLIGAETVTDVRGRAVMAAFSQEEIRSVDVTSEVYGRQDFGFVEINADPKIIRLRPVGRLRGRLVGDREAIRRCPLRVNTAEIGASYGLLLTWVC